MEGKSPKVILVRRRAPSVRQAFGRAMEQAFLFVSAGRGAPTEVQKAIRRYRQLPAQVRAQKPLLWWLLPDGTPPYKFQKAEVAFGPPPAEVGQARCGNCGSLYFHPTTQTYICDRMRGVIDSPGTAWCRVWNPPRQPADYRNYQERG